MLSTPFFIWFQGFCFLAAVSGTATSAWLNKTENRNGHDQGELMHFLVLFFSLFFLVKSQEPTSNLPFFNTGHPAVTHLTSCTESAYFVWDNPKRTQPKPTNKTTHKTYCTGEGTGELNLIPTIFADGLRIVSQTCLNGHPTCNSKGKCFLNNSWNGS